MPTVASEHNCSVRLTHSKHIYDSITLKTWKYFQAIFIAFYNGVLIFWRSFTDRIKLNQKLRKSWLKKKKYNVLVTLNTSDRYPLPFDELFDILLETFCICITTVKISTKSFELITFKTDNKLKTNISCIQSMNCNPPSTIIYYNFHDMVFHSIRFLFLKKLYEYVMGVQTVDPNFSKL